MLSAAPGFFVDHEDGEGLGNDVYLRGFDLDNGSGIEMKVGEVPINIPLHIHGQGYADVNFIIPEVVRSIRVLEGPYDPRQGDSAIVGSALFDLGVPERGYQLKTTYGSFGQARVVGIAAPKEASDETFAAFSLRETQGFGEDRASKSASVNAQYGVDLDRQRSPPRPRHRVRRERGAAGRRAPGRRQRWTHRLLRRLPVLQFVLPDEVHFGVVRAAGAGRRSRARHRGGGARSRDRRGALRDRAVGHVDQLPLAAELHGDLNSSNLQPQLASLGDLWQLTNVETAWGVTARFHSAPIHIGDCRSRSSIEPGVSLRAGHTDQSKSLVNPADLDPWDYRENYALDTVDLAGYLDLDVRLWKKLRISGGVARRLSRRRRSRTTSRGSTPPVPAGALQGSASNVAGVAPGPARHRRLRARRRELTPVVSAGEGFRSLDAGSLTLCNTPTVQLTGVPRSRYCLARQGRPTRR